MSQVWKEKPPFWLLPVSELFILIEVCFLSPGCRALCTTLPLDSTPRHHPARKWAAAATGATSCMNGWDDAAAKNNWLVSWIRYTMQHGKSAQYHSFNELSKNFICWNFELLSDLPQYASLETELLIELLQRDDLVIKDEFSLFKCISKWLMHQLSKHAVPVKRSTASSCIVNEGGSDGQLSFPDLVKEITSLIRFPLMSYRELANVLMDPLAKDYEYLFTSLITDAMKFNAIGNEAREEEFSQMKGNFEYDTSPFTPRLYTDEMWSSSLVIENYSDIPPHTARTFVFETANTLFDNAPKADHKMSSKRLRTTEPTAVQEWAVDLYPKGVYFDKAKLISPRSSSVSGTFVPSWQKETVRIAVSTTTPYTSSILFNVGVLIYGQQDGVEFVRHVSTRRRYFEGQERVLQIEDLVPFKELNARTAIGRGALHQSPLLIGNDRNTLRVQVVITPIGC